MHQQQSLEKTERGRLWPCGFRHGTSVQAGCIQCAYPKRWYHLLTKQDIPGTSVSVCSFIIHTRYLCSSVPCFSPIPNVHTGLNDQTCQESSETLHAYLTKSTVIHVRGTPASGKTKCSLDEIYKDRWNHSCLTVANKG